MSIVRFWRFDAVDVGEIVKSWMKEEKESVNDG